MRDYDRQLFGHVLTALDKWIHLTILMSWLAEDHGADPAEVDRLFRADKETIDRLLVEKMKERGRDD